MVAEGGTSRRGHGGGGPGRMARILSALLIALFLILSYELFVGALVWAFAGLFGLPPAALAVLAAAVALSGVWLGIGVFRRSFAVDL